MYDWEETFAFILWVEEWFHSFGFIHLVGVLIQFVFIRIRDLPWTLFDVMMIGVLI